MHTKSEIGKMTIAHQNYCTNIISWDMIIHSKTPALRGRKSNAEVPKNIAFGNSGFKNRRQLPNHLGNESTNRTSTLLSIVPLR